MTARVLGSLVVGGILGLALAHWQPAGAPFAAASADALGTLWVRAMGVTVLPLVAALLIHGVTSLGDPRRLSRAGALSIGAFFLLHAINTAISFLMAPSLLAGLHIDPADIARLRAANTVATPASVPTPLDWVMSLVPQNIFKTAADGAMLPFILFVLAFAVALSRVSDDSLRKPVVAFFSGLAEVMMTLVRWILALAPVGVFALALALTYRLGLTALGAMAWYAGAMILVLVVCLAVCYAVAMLGARLSFRTFAQTAAPAQAIGFSSRSSIAALPAMMTAAQDTLRLPAGLVSFLLPFAVSLFRANVPPAHIVGIFFAAKLYGVPLGAAQLAGFAVTAVLLSFSVPGIPSGSLFVMAPAYVAVGIPAEVLGIFFAVDVVPDLFKTTLNVTSHLAATALVGARVPSDSSTS